MARFVQPPRDQHDKLRRPLTPGERKVFRIFDACLPAGWEIYIEPHLNGLRPDMVLLHPAVGIAVFEVKDWNLHTLDLRRAAKPLEQVLRYKEEIYELYCPRLSTQGGFAAITAGVIFPFADDDQLRSVLGSAYRERVKPGLEGLCWPRSRSGWRYAALEYVCWRPPRIGMACTLPVLAINPSGGLTRRADRRGAGRRGLVPRKSAPWDSPSPRATVPGVLGATPGAVAPG
jgi:hypothetical protein